MDPTAPHHRRPARDLANLLLHTAVNVSHTAHLLGQLAGVVPPAAEHTTITADVRQAVALINQPRRQLIASADTLIGPNESHIRIRRERAVSPAGKVGVGRRLSSCDRVGTGRILVSDAEEEPSLPLARRLAVELDGAAETEISRTGSGLTVRVTPYRTAARAIEWTDFGDEIIVQVGDIGGRWELSAEAADLAFMQDLVMSVVAGRVSEVFAYRRSRVTVTFPDGSAEAETGYDGLTACLPLPLWPRWSRTTRYLPYR